MRASEREAAELVKAGKIPEEAIALGTMLAEYLSTSEREGRRYRLQVTVERGERDEAEMVIECMPWLGIQNWIVLRLTAEGWIVVYNDESIAVPIR